MGLPDQYDDRIDLPESRRRIIKMLGNNTAAPTKTFGAGVALTRTGVGDYKATFNENPGVYVGVAGYSFESATATDVKGYTCTVKSYDSTNFVVEFLVFNSSFAAADLNAQSIVLEILFKRTQVSG